MIKFSVMDYLGKYTEGNIQGMFVLLSLNYQDSNTEAICFYNNESIDLTVDTSLEESLGCKIENHPEYQDLLIRIVKSLVPFNEIINQTDEINLSAYTNLLKNDIDIESAEEIDESQIKKQD